MSGVAEAVRGISLTVADDSECRQINAAEVRGVRNRRG